MKELIQWWRRFLKQKGSKGIKGRGLLPSEKEVSLFILLERLRALQREDLWQREYERAIQTDIKPRDRLSDAYRHLKSHGQLPAYY